MFRFDHDPGQKIPFFIMLGFGDMTKSDFNR